VDFDESVLIARPAADVFALLADVQDCLEPGSPVLEMEKIPPGPTRVGTRWREVVRIGPWHTMTMWSDVTAVEPDRLLAVRFRGGGMEGTLSYEITPEDGVTTLRQRQTVVAVGWLRPLGWLMSRMLWPRVRDRLNGIRDDLERRS